NTKETLVKDLAALQNEFYKHHISFVICKVQPVVFSLIKHLELDDVMNTTPTETEARDIVQMEEVQRELLDDGF
ncbi:MAG TPA: hypothetical protein VGI61_03950, partial [Parafilimonas sp.]